MEEKKKYSHLHFSCASKCIFPNGRFIPIMKRRQPTSWEDDKDWCQGEEKDEERMIQRVESGREGQQESKSVQWWRRCLTYKRWQQRNKRCYGGGWTWHTGAHTYVKKTHSCHPLDNDFSPWCLPPHEAGSNLHSVLTSSLVIQEPISILLV